MKTSPVALLARLRALAAAPSIDGRVMAGVLAVALALGAGLASSNAVPRATPLVAGPLRAEAVPSGLLPALQSAGRRCTAVTSPLLAAQALVHAKWQQDYVDPYGAQGLGRFTRATWSEFGVDADGDGIRSRSSGADSLAAQAKYLCWLDAYVRRHHVKGERLANVLAAYMAGPGAVRSAGGVPDRQDVKSYVAATRAVLALYLAGTESSTGGAESGAQGGESRRQSLQEPVVRLPGCGRCRIHRAQQPALVLSRP